MSVWPINRGVWRFFLRWLRKPRSIGAVVPSGNALADAMAGCIDIDAPGIVIELGGGTGCVTEAILRAGVPPTHLITIEREPEFCEMIASRLPEATVLCADACDLEALADGPAMPPVKAIVSSLPLLSIREEERNRILDSAFAVLADGGEFFQFTYGPSNPISRDMRDMLGIEGARSEWVLSNIPPAAVWRFRRKVFALDHRRAA